ncbi:hypothetical protein [Romboutsia lituseburensis]|uniref:hypothetical protein n=1 Tax=Romboutsia lituseburensis TaxID=1537 RepID=UPI00215A7F95|nr:hypothetical protein [Romboutsia lituseburensis]MCR8744471.1 hypothetical protein [Romboutsia lituseburensis]
MNINYDILQNFLRCNKNIKLNFRENSNILDVVSYSQVILTLELDNTDLVSNSEVIYDSITKLDGVTMYIPKIYIK